MKFQSYPVKENEAAKARAPIGAVQPITFFPRFRVRRICARRRLQADGRCVECVGAGGQDCGGARGTRRGLPMPVVICSDAGALGLNRRFAMNIPLADSGKTPIGMQV
jgi:hypothetical protein